MARYVYREDGSGRLRAIKVAKKPLHKGTPDCMGMDFNTMMLDAYRKAENAGQPLRGPFTPKQIKRIHGA